MTHCCNRPAAPAPAAPSSRIALAILFALGAASCEGAKPQPHEAREAAFATEGDDEGVQTSQSVQAQPVSTPQQSSADPGSGEGPGEASGPEGPPNWKLPASEIPASREPAIPAKAAADEYAGWGTFRMGRASFRHPKGWSVQTTAYGLVLTPSGSRAEDELIVVTANAAPGITKGTDRRVGEALDQTIAATMPAMRRRGRPQEISSSIGSGGRFDYAGRAPDGRRAEGSVYVAVDEGKAAAISIVAEPRRLEKRRPVIEQIFRSFVSGSSARGGDRNDKAAPGGLDPRLVGMFAGEAIHSGKGNHVNTRLVYALGADGVLHYGAQSGINLSKGDGAGGFKWTASGITGGNVERGTWSTASGLITVRWDSGAVGTVAYSFEPNGALVLRDPYTKKLINFYERVK